MIFFILNISPPPPLSSPSLWEGEDYRRGWVYSS